jgi:hypothetical protein
MSGVPTSIPASLRPASVVQAAVTERGAGRYLWLFVLIQIGCQLGLLVESLGALRVLLRSAAFGTSILLLLLVPGAARRHPAHPWLLACLAVVGLSVFHPTTNTPLGGFAHAMLYVAVAAPVFWACRLHVSVAMFRRIVLTLWLFHTASAGVGVLQMYYPGRFQPNVSTAISSMGVMADAYKIRLADGQLVWRPMGLTDMPGGAASAGLYAVLFGLGVFLAYPGALRIVSVAGIGVGLFCLYMAQVRSLLVMAGICSIALVSVLMWRGEVRRLLGVALVLPVVFVGAFQWAARVGGAETVQRVNTLVEERATEVYSRNRGLFLEHTFTELVPQYPLGAGLARWGMMRNYFGDDSNTLSPALYVEIQWTGWLLDGGVLLMVLYPLAVVMTCRLSLKVALGTLPGSMPLWGALLFSLNMATVAVTFNYPLFIGQGGMESWFLNGCLFAAALTAGSRARRQRAVAQARTEREAQLA